MKKLNQKGFGIVEIMLVVVLVGLVGGIGYYVYSQAQKNDETSAPSSDSSVKIEKKSEPAPVAKDETADWLLYESPGGEFKIKLADGWSLERYLKSPAVYKRDNKLEIKPGTKAVVTEVQGGGDFITGLGIDYRTSKEIQEGPLNNPRGVKQASLKTNDGLEITVYHFTQTNKNPMLDVPYGGEEYSYHVSNAKGGLEIFYSYKKGEVDYHKEVEKILSSIEIQ